MHSLQTSHSDLAHSAKATQLTQGHEGARNLLHEARWKLSKVNQGPPTPDSSGKLEAGDAGEKWRRSCSQNISRSEKRGWENWPLVSSLTCLLKVVATPPSSSFPCQQLFLKQNRTGQHVPSGHSPGEIQIVRGRWEAAERRLEPWRAVCHPAHHPLFPLQSGFLLLYSQHSLQVPGNIPSGKYI